MTDTQFDKLITEIIQIESNTSGSKDAGYNAENLNQIASRVRCVQSAALELEASAA